MKKVLVLVVAILALASLATMAHADTIIFQDSWAYAFATWQGSNQDTYPADPHAITDSAVLSPFSGETGNYVGKMIYNKSQEAWSGHLTSAAGVNLSGVTRLQFKVRSDDSMNVPVVINKVVVNDSNNAALTIKAGFEAPLGSWSTIQSDAGTFEGRNMAAVKMPFGFYMGDTDNSGITTGDNCIFYFDDVKFVGGGTGTVRVTLTSGVVGVQIEQSVNFDLVLGGITTNTSYNSADIGDDTQSHFIVTNKGTDPCYYRVSLINPGGWTAVAPFLGANSISLSRQDEYCLYGQFAQVGASPAGDMASYAVADGITTTAKAADAGVLDYSGTGDGRNVAKDAVRNLWIALHTPASTGVGTTQEIKVIISAVKL